jgi:hypothetical protein
MSERADRIVTDYVSAWITDSPAVRDELIERAWSPDGVYSDPMNYAAGRAEFVSLIERFHQTRPGATFDLTSGVDEHHGFLRFQWRMRTTDGQAIMEGFDIGELDEHGRLKRITGFFGPFPPLSPA